MLYRGSVVSARYNMTAEFYPQTATQSESGQITRSWDYDNPLVIRNYTKGITGGGIRVVGSTETWGQDYEAVEWAKMFIATQSIDNNFLNRRWRVSKIKSIVNGNSLWLDDNGSDIEFNINGITPIDGGFGIIEYELLLKGVTGD
jgi:hypothetical protein